MIGSDQTSREECVNMTANQFVFHFISMLRPIPVKQNEKLSHMHTAQKEL